MLLEEQRYPLPQSQMFSRSTGETHGYPTMGASFLSYEFQKLEAFNAYWEDNNVNDKNEKAFLADVERLRNAHDRIKDLFMSEWCSFSRKSRESTISLIEDFTSRSLELIKCLLDADYVGVREVSLNMNKVLMDTNEKLSRE